MTSFKTSRVKRDASVDTLQRMISTMRPAGSAAEVSFIAEHIAPLGAKPDAYGNMVLRLGTAPVLWSSHTDTVHSKSGAQRIETWGSTIQLAAHERRSTCLGADCTAGVWLMSQMVNHRVPGLYIWHRAEEIGGLGSEHIATKTPELLAGIKFAIAFDRKGHSDIITHQWGGRCASETFARSLAPMLPGHYRADDTGSFTDTANYTELVGECSNISVGYEHAHSSSETLNVDHLVNLRDHLLLLDSTKLVAVRTPAPREKPKAFGSSHPWSLDDLWGDFPETPARKHKGRFAPLHRAARTMQEFVRLYPDAVADMLDVYGIDVSEAYDHAPWLP